MASSSYCLPFHCIILKILFFLMLTFFNLLTLPLHQYVEGNNLGGALNFTRVPPSLTRETTAFFEFTLIEDGGQGDNLCSECVIKCQLDKNIEEDCLPGTLTYTELEDGYHVLSISVQNSQTHILAAQYNWTVDTVQPTAYIYADSPFTNAANISLDILFSEACPGRGGFKCDSASSCDVVAHGAGQVIPSSLEIVRPFIEYKIVIGLSTMSPTGRVTVVMAKNLCTDYAGNSFQRNENSTFIIHSDRRILSVNVWVMAPEYRVKIGNQERTVQATNNKNLLQINVDFSVPVSNTSEEVLSALRASAGQLSIAYNRTHGSRRFRYLLNGISATTVVTISLETNSILSRSGNFILLQYSTTSVHFLYDSTRPAVSLSTSSVAKNKEQIVPVAVEFTKPVFSFSASDIKISGGLLKSFNELSKSLYILEVAHVDGNSMSIYVPENRTMDIAGNSNIQSNPLQVRHYSVPPISVALYSLTTAAVLATSFTAGALCVSSASLEAVGALSSQSVVNIYSDPSRNLLGLVSHIQVFALSDWLSVTLPVEYHETIKGLQWIIPHIDLLPWKKKRKNDPSPQNPFGNGNLYISVNTLPNLQQEKNGSIIELKEKKITANSSLFGPPLNPSEYAMYFEYEGSKPIAEDILNLKSYTGWGDFSKNMFWVGVFGGGLSILHVLIFFLMRAKLEADLEGTFVIPRFELFFFILALPCICQASGFLLRGGSMLGILVGVLLLSVPTSFVLSVLLLILVMLFTSGFVNFEEKMTKPKESSSLMPRPSSRPWHEGVLTFLAGTGRSGEWVRKEGISQSFLDRFGLIFEDRKGIVATKEGGNTNPSCCNVIGAFRLAYIVVDLVKRMVLGLIFGVYNRVNPSRAQVLSALLLTLFQLLYLLFFKPYIRRGVQLVESLSLICEAGVFAATLELNRHSTLDYDQHLGYVMLSLLLVCLVSQLLSEWYALLNELMRLSKLGDSPPSLVLGFRLLLFGILILFLPQDSWSSFLPRPPPSSPYNPYTDSGRSIVYFDDPIVYSTQVELDRDEDSNGNNVEIRTDSHRAESEPALNSGLSSDLSRGLSRGTTERQEEDEVKRCIGPKLDPIIGHVDTLQEMARASFSKRSRASKPEKVQKSSM